MGAAALLDVAIALRLADEGVPLRAIARAAHIPSEDLRYTLQEAQADGRLVQLPHDDWPPGFPRDQRSLQLSRLKLENPDDLFLAVQEVFALTRAQVQLLLAMIQGNAMSKTRDDMTTKTVDVHICHMRPRLTDYGIKIVTLWGYGYQLSVSDRRRAMDLILQQVAALPTL